MAQYIEKLFATDSYMINETTKAVSRDNILTAHSEHSFYYSGGTNHPKYAPLNVTSIKVVYPEAIIKDKKRLVKTEYYNYVTNKSLSTYGSLTVPRSFIYGISDSPQNFLFIANNSWTIQYQDCSTILNTSYNVVKKSELFLFSGMDSPYYIDDYSSNLNLSIHSHTGTNKPYVLYTYEDIIPFASSRTPSKFLDKKQPTTFKWVFDYDKTNTYGALKQASAKLRYKNVGDANYTEVSITGDVNSYTVPANTFTSNSVQWQVLVTSDDGIATTQNDWVTLTTIDSTPVCEPVYPDGVTVDSTQSIEFKWNHVIDTNSPQTKYDFQYSQDNGVTWSSVITETTSRQSYTMPANTLTSDKVSWKARTYNTDNIASAWSRVCICVVKSKPLPPDIIDVTNQARPTITWASTGQEAYRLSIKQLDTVIYETDKIAGTIKEFKCPIYLQNGDYNIELYITNKYGLESDKETFSFSIDIVKQTIPNLSVSNIDYGVKLSISSLQPNTKMYVLRNGVPIKKLTTETEWIDYTSIGTNEYVLRCVFSDDSFNDSNSIAATTTINYATLSSVYNPGIMVELKLKREEKITHRKTVQYIGNEKFYSGREFPVFEFSNNKSVVYPYVYSFRNESDFIQFEKIINLRTTLLYRNNKGELQYGVVKDYEVERDKYAHTVSFNFIKVDYNEAVQYD